MAKKSMEAMLGKNGVASSSEQLQLHGLENLGSIHWNLSAPALYQEAIRRKEGVVTAGGALTVATGIHTGRSPKDKFITLLRIIRSVDSNDRIILMVRCQAIAKKIITFLNG